MALKCVRKKPKGRLTRVPASDLPGQSDQSKGTVEVPPQLCQTSWSGLAHQRLKLGNQIWHRFWCRQRGSARQKRLAQGLQGMARWPTLLWLASISWPDARLSQDLVSTVPQVTGLPRGWQQHVSAEGKTPPNCGGPRIPRIPEQDFWVHIGLSTFSILSPCICHPYMLTSHLATAIGPMPQLCAPGRPNRSKVSCPRRPAASCDATQEARL